jgi:hypothetical protein
MMASNKKRSGNSQKEKKGYARKVERGLVPHVYDKNGRSFQQGAWKNLSLSDAETNRRALGHRVAA